MVRITQAQTYRCDDWWDWSVWLEGLPAELDAINEVVWCLHPSFTPSKVTRRNRDEGFRLSTSGWGTFTIRAELRLKSGREELLTHDLELLYPDDEEGTAPTKSDGRPEVGGYVRDLDLPAVTAPPRGFDQTDGFDESWPLIVVGRQIVEFADGVSGKVRRTVCHGLLLAELAADKKVPGGEPFPEWYGTYSDVLNNIGWSRMRRDAKTQQLQDANAPLYEAVLPALAAVLRPSVAADSRLLWMLRRLREVDSESPWLTLLDRNSLGSRGGAFGLARVGGSADGGANLTSFFVQVEASQRVTTLLFLRVSKADVRVQTLAIESTIDVQMLAATEAALAAKVEPFVIRNVRGVDVGFSPTGNDNRRSDVTG